MNINLKRMLIWVLAGILCFMNLSACTKNQAPNKGDTTLCAWFDENGLKEELTQKDYLSLLEHFSIKGKSLSKIAPCAKFDYGSTSGCSASCSSFSYGQEYVAGDPSQIVCYLTYVENLDGLNLPFDLAIGSSLFSAVTAFNGEYAAVQSFIRQGAKDTMILSSSLGEELLFRNLSVNEEQTAFLYPLQLIYTEQYTVTRSDGVSSTVTRTLEMSFSHQSNGSTLSQVRIIVSEEY